MIRILIDQMYSLAGKDDPKLRVLKAEIYHTLDLEKGRMLYSVWIYGSNGVELSIPLTGVDYPEDDPKVLVRAALDAIWGGSDANQSQG